ncbi:MAG TPA: glycosyltransferase family 1 protein [Bryobacteraceae bacterium]|jgi:glycosyltransferase involved in cell wall biosynthesis|nr:glycosyltransferase family 1 protein [Bryobacteraceae bacterium]
MRFALDAHAIGRHLTGNEVYARNLLNGFAAQDKESEFLAYLSVEDARAWVPASVQVRAVSPNPFIRLGYDLSFKLRQDRPDLVHVQYTAPLGCPVPVVVSVHDVSFLEHPEYFTRLRAMQLRWTVGRTVRSAARIVTGSDFSRHSILRAYPEVDPERVVAVPNAAATSFRPTSREQAAANIRSAFRVNGPFILSVGDLQPRKNQIGLIRAFADMIRACPEFPHHLVLAGQETWYAPRVREVARQSGVADRIHFSGFVTDEQLLQLYNACDLFVFPSFYEGFGLPVLEAMACGKAVACSSTSAVPEVADGAALLFDPYAPEEIARAMVDLIRDAELRARMERLGLQRSAHFSWYQTAQQTLEIYHQVAEEQRATGKVLRSAPIPQR